MITIGKKSFVDADAYLNRKGWQLSELPEELNNDSIQTAAWKIDSPSNREKLSIAEVVLQFRIGQKPMVQYFTIKRHCFDSIKNSVTSLRMEDQGSVSSSGIGSLYYGTTYAVVLSIVPPKDNASLHYVVQLKAHGLTKLYSQQEDGSYKSEWRQLIMHGYKSLPDSGTIIYSTPDSTSSALGRVEKGELLLVKPECSECGDDYYKISIHLDNNKSSPMSDDYYSIGYVLKSEVEYKRLTTE